MAVALLGQGRLKDGIEVLEAALEASPSTLAMAEPFLFNLCAFYPFPCLASRISLMSLLLSLHLFSKATLYELRSSIAADKKRDLLIEVAKWSGDGLRTSCLKMPT